MAKLEQTVAILQQQLAAANGPPADWARKVAGIVTDDEAFEVAMACGRAWRRADRPQGDDAEQP